MSTIPRPGAEVLPRPWQTGLAPVYIGMFLWVGFFDQIGRRALPMGGLGWSALGAALAGPFAYLLLFRAPAHWGHRSGRPLPAVASSTFGARGAWVVPGLLVGIAQVVLFAVAIGYAVDLTFRGLLLFRLVDAQSLRPIQVGGATLKAPLYLATALFWAIATALVSLRFIRWVAFLMQFFPVFPAAMLGAAMLATLTGLRSFHPALAPGQLAPSAEDGLRACLLTFQWVFAFSSMAGVMGADWGSASVRPGDVRVGGWVGLALAPAIVSALALLAVAGYQGMKETPRGLEDARFSPPSITELPAPGRPAAAAGSAGLAAPAYTFQALLDGRFDPRVGGLMFLTFGLASLAPAVYSSFTFGAQFKDLGPGISRLTWTMLGTCTAWLLLVGGWFDRAAVAFDLLGAAFAPVAGAIAADYRRHRGRWAGPRVGTNPAGVIAWGVGLAVGLAPAIGRASGSGRLLLVQPAALWAFVAAYLTYELLAIFRMESATTSATTTDPASP